MAVSPGVCPLVPLADAATAADCTKALRVIKLLYLAGKLRGARGRSHETKRWPVAGFQNHGITGSLRASQHVAENEPGERALPADETLSPRAGDESVKMRGILLQCAIARFLSPYWASSA